MINRAGEWEWALLEKKGNTHKNTSKLPQKQTRPHNCLMSDLSRDKRVVENTGKLLLAGFEGYEITPDCQAVKLIKIHKVRSFILGSKNFVNVPQITKLIDDLQTRAKLEGYERPLLIAVDQELGCCNAMFDEIALTQFPGAMGLAATDDVELIYRVGEALAIELRSIGFNFLMGPDLDICSRMSNQLIGVRSFGSTVEDVTKYATAFARGLKKGGILTCAKHFPGIGSSFVDNLLELPMMLETYTQLECFNVLPFKNLIDEGLIDSVHAGGVAVPNISPNEIHACLSPVIVQKLLRKNCKFDGLVVSECLELESLCRNVGLGQGAVLAILYARCDMVMVCSDYIYQEEALSSLTKAYESGNYDPIFAQSVRRIDELHRKLQWSEKIQLTPDLWNEHQKLSIQAYSKSITLVRDQEDVLPINKYFTQNDENNVVVLTPLITQIHPDTIKFFTQHTQPMG
ncbi:unnamed protein product [Ambrosiozyma monospora]|uniref:Unnamed protein product n=1 Tax=Ambrosiozyma monospora TaxID=43982 RepID=A0ACB5T4U3_AMBMO|nr:unnamed protein product [Ambrosiozyma monospora]